jgi:glutathione S-transferase
MMSAMEPISLLGAFGSPYTRKMTAILRYRHIPYRLIHGSHMEATSRPKPKVALLPTFYLKNESGEIEAVVDSTPLTRRLERDYGGRSVIPDDPALRFLDELLEDYADEWLTKAMFHYRWYYPADIAQAGAILPRWRVKPAHGAAIDQAMAFISQRQIGRLYVVGSNPTTAPVIEASYVRFLKSFGAHLENHAFLLGERPSACDFGVYGQLTQLARFDPTPMKLALDHAPRVFAWVDVVDDLSGYDPPDAAWLDSASIPDTLKAIFIELGRCYVPVMLANANALIAGAKTVETEVDGLPWVQDPFPYQGRCLHWLRQSYAALDAQAKGRVDQALAGTGCEVLLG